MIHRSHVAALVTTALISSIAASPAFAQAVVSFNLPAQELSKSLKSVARATNTNIVFNPTLVQGRQAPPLHGQFDAETAIARLIAGQALTEKSTGSGTFVISGSTPRGNAPAAAEAAPSLGEEQAAGAAATNESANQTIVVTGTNIRHVAPLSPLMRFSREEIAKQGYTRVDQLVDQLPQNFSGGGTSQRNNPIGLGATASASTNYAFTSSVNLRGLGPNTTLVLLNGHRLPSTSYGLSTDISRIPLSAVERVEVLTDGASATYGADAVGGVMNIITRVPASGFEVGARANSIASGKSPDIGGYLLGGHEWSTGGVLLSVDYERDNKLLASRRSFSQDAPSPTALLPDIKNLSGYARVDQAIGDNLHITLDGLASRRRFSAVYSFFGFLNRNYGGGNQYSVDFDATYSFARTWQLELFLSQGNSSDDNNSNFFGSTIVRKIRYRTRAGEARVDGPLFDLPGGPMRIALGGVLRGETYRDNAITRAQLAAGSRAVNSLYGEILAPFSSANSAIGKLELSLAARYDHYEDFGSTTNPKIATQWEPIRGLRLRGSFGTSFRAPPLSQLDRNATNFAYVWDFPDPSVPAGVRRAILLDSSANPDLKPERARSFDLGVVVQPTSIPKLRVELSYFNIRFKDRIVRLSDFEFNNAFADADQFGNFVNLQPSLADVSSALSLPNLTVIDFNDPPGFTPEQIKGIAYFGIVNAGVVKADGLDFLARHAWQLSTSEIYVSANASYFLNYKTQITPTSTPAPGINRVGSPPRFRGKLEAGFDRRQLSGFARLNYASSYRNQFDTSCGSDLCKVSSYATADVGLNYSSSTRSRPGWSVGAAIFNIFDRKPPHVGVLDGHYDSANANPLGRFASLSVSARF